MPPSTRKLHRRIFQRCRCRTYQYDAAGNITQIASELGQTQYAYDALQRLTLASPNTALQTLGLPQEQYSYDGVHNRTSSAHQVGAWVYNQDNQLVQYPELKNSQGTPSQTLPTQVTYTPTGHTAGEANSQGSKTYRYNAAERLVEVSQSTTQGTTGSNTASTTTSYRYDPFGRRISKTATQNGTTSTTYFVYNDTGLMAELNAQGQMTKAYGFNPIAAQAGLWSTDPLWQAEVSNNSLTTTATSYHYLHTDHLGTPMLATTSTGQTSWKGISEAFGQTRVDNGSQITMNLRFSGQYWDAETNSHYNYFRDYQPHKGRYVQSDPIGLYGGINTFAYVDGNPLANFDPNGQSWIAKIAGCAVGFAAGYYAGDSIRGTIRDFNELRKKRSAKSDCGSESKEVTPNTQSGYSGGLVGDALSVTGENLIKLVISTGIILAKNAASIEVTLCKSVGFWSGLVYGDGSFSDKVNDIGHQINDAVQNRKSFK